MRTLYNSNIIKIPTHGSPQSLKIICDDGVVYCDRLLFILWSKNWRNILDQNEETNVLICPDMKKEIVELVLELLMTGESSGLEKDFEIFFETILDIFEDLPEGFSNFQTSEKSFKDRAKNLIARRNTFKGLRLNGHVCEYCLSLFSSKQSKDRHIDYYHRSENLVSCSVCNVGFRTKEGLAAHEKAKHRDKIEKFKCDKCDARFENESSLKRHMKIVDHDAIKKICFVCANCDKVFKTRKELNMHKKKLNHNQESEEIDLSKKFKCSESDCNFATSRMDSLLRHQRLVHGLYRKNFKAISKTLADGGNWTCSKCGKTFTSDSDIRSHVIQCKEIECEFCHKTFKLRHHLKCHMDKKHSNYICKICKRGFENILLLREHELSNKCDQNQD